MNNPSSIEMIYWASTAIGGTLFVLRTIMLLFGGGLNDADLDTSFDADLSGDIDVSGDIDADFDGDHAGAYASFKLLSLQGLTAFFMMFGLVGLALLKAELHVLLTVFGGATAGLFTVWVMGLVFSQMKHLQSDGTINLNNAVGEKGTVYLTIPSNSSGQVQITIQGSLKIYDAISKNKKKIATGEKIQVVDKADGNTLIVEKTQ
ncbi:MAG: hypothetical protein GY755_20920 [Chloroflexi bacterium]|nr:hypothetical protein [Chloroflexota bacterium]